MPAVSPDPVARAPGQEGAIPCHAGFAADQLGKRSSTPRKIQKFKFLRITQGHVICYPYVNGNGMAWTGDVSRSLYQAFDSI